MLMMSGIGPLFLGKPVVSKSKNTTGVVIPEQKNIEC